VTVLHSIEKWLWRCELVQDYASVLAALTMMCLTSADALSRYLLNRSDHRAYEITEKYLMVGDHLSGSSFAYRGGVFIRVTFLVDRLPARM
jgi:TRAP-type C4-dicarboxylate transport system permease small subunit